MDSKRPKVELSDIDLKTLANIEDTHKAFNYLLEKYFDYSSSLKIVFDSTHKDLAINLLYAKAIKTYYAIYTLSIQGYGGDALILLRSLLDIKINMKYIWYADLSIADRFFEYENYSKYNYIMSKLDEEPNFIKSYNKKLFDFDVISEAAKLFPKKYPKGNPNNWSGISIKGMIDSLPEKEKEEEEKAYKTVYRLTSAYVHSNVIALRAYLSKGSIFNIAPDTGHIETAYTGAVLLLDKILSLWQQFMHVKLSPDLEKDFINFQIYFISKFPPE